MSLLRPLLPPRLDFLGTVTPATCSAVLRVFGIDNCVMCLGAPQRVSCSACAALPVSVHDAAVDGTDFGLPFDVVVVRMRVAV